MNIKTKLINRSFRCQLFCVCHVELIIKVAYLLTIFMRIAARKYCRMSVEIWTELHHETCETAWTTGGAQHFGTRAEYGYKLHEKSVALLRAKNSHLCFNLTYYCYIWSNQFAFSFFWLSVIAIKLMMIIAFDRRVRALLFYTSNRQHYSLFCYTKPTIGLMQ